MRIVTLTFMGLMGFSSFAQSDAELIASISKIREISCDSAVQVAESLRPEMGTPSDRHRLEKEIGLSYYCSGNYEMALMSYQRALEGFKEQGMILESGSTLNLIGTLHKKQGDMEAALDYFNQGLTYSREHADSLGLGNSLNNIGLVYLQTDRTEQALDYFLESTAVKAAVGDTIGLSYNYDNLGQSYSALGDFEEARRYFELAAAYKKMIGEEVGYAIVQNNIGEMLLRSGDAESAESYFMKALEVASAVKFRDFKQYVLSQLSAVKDAQGDPVKAFDYYKRHVALKDSLFNERKSEQVAELETRYQTEKKEREIEAQAAELQQNKILLASAGGLILLLIGLGIQGRSRLKWKNRKQLEEQKALAREAEIHAVINSQEKERNRFARDLHDGFGQLISTLNLNLRNLNNPKDKSERERVFDASSKVLDEMYQELKNICFDLMPQTLVKQGLEAALQEFANRINISDEKRVEVNVFGLDNRLEDIQEISLYRISQEWVNNILKYSDAQKITVQVTRDEEEITLLIEDDGMGFDPVVLKQGTGNGWKNMRSRANLMKAELEIESNPGRRGNSLILNAEVKRPVEQAAEIPV